MIKSNVYNLNGEKVKDIELNSDIFDVELNEGLVHQIVEAQLSNARQVLAHTKDRGDVRGGGKKPWKQKGTGRARHGSTRSPLWIGGGVTFGPRNDRNFSKKVNKKMKKKALFMCLTDKVKNELLVLVDKIEFETPKTKLILDAFKKLPVIDTKIKKIKIKGKKDEKNIIKEKEVKEIGKSLIIISNNQENVALSIRNLKNIDIIRANSLNVVDLLKYKYLIMAVDSLDVIEKTYLS